MKAGGKLFTASEEREREGKSEREKNSSVGRFENLISVSMAEGKK